MKLRSGRTARRRPARGTARKSRRGGRKAAKPTKDQEGAE
jgi:hypothetical protein